MNGFSPSHGKENTHEKGKQSLRSAKRTSWYILGALKEIWKVNDSHLTKSSTPMFSQRISFLLSVSDDAKSKQKLLGEISFMQNLDLNEKLGLETWIWLDSDLAIW